MTIAKVTNQLIESLGEKDATPDVKVTTQKLEVFALADAIPNARVTQQKVEVLHGNRRPADPRGSIRDEDVIPGNPTNIKLFDYALVYDIALRRWGKVKIAHTDTIDIFLGEHTVNVGEGTAVINDEFKPKRNIGFLHTDGSLSIMDFEQDNYTAEGVVLFGKIQLHRKAMCTLQEIVLENTDEATDNFILKVGQTLNGKDIEYPLTSPVLTSEGSKTKEFKTRLTGKNLILFIKGAFNIVTGELYLTNNGDR